jgi:hypothetical protein
MSASKTSFKSKVNPDAELVAVSVLLHDLGLARGGAPDRRFEVVGELRACFKPPEQP